MAVLSKEFLDSGNCYIGFYEFPEDVDLDACSWVREDHDGELFFKFPESLLETYCSITRSYSMFDPHVPTQFSKPHEIRKIAVEMLHWASVILRCQDGVFMQHFDLYVGVESRVNVTAEEMRKDLIDTILFLVERITRIAASNRILALDGI